MAELPVISVIIPTVATTERAPYLRRALASVLSQRGVAVAPIVVVNGARPDAALVGELQARSDITCLRLTEADLPAAITAGRRAVASEFFTELDDDDLLLDGALVQRFRRLQASPDADAVVSNGYIRSETDEWMSIPDVAAVQDDPLAALLRSNWLLPGAALFRSRTVTADLFAGMPRYLEWTYVAAYLAIKRTLLFSGEPTIRHFVNHSFSVDDSLECVLGRPDALRRLLGLDLPAFARRRIAERIAHAHHAVSCAWLNEGWLAGAWAAHGRCLKQRGGWRYLSYTHRLLMPRSLTGRRLRPRRSDKLELFDDATH